MFNLLAPPLYEYNEETRRSRYLHILILATAGITTLVCIINIIILPATSTRWITLIAILNGVSFVFLALNKKNKYRPSAIGYIIFLSAIIFVLAWSAGGIRAPVIQNIPIAVLIAGLLLNLRAGINTALLAMAGAGMLVFAEYTGLMPQSSITHNPLSIWINYGLTLSMLTLLYYLSLSGRTMALKQAEHELSLRKKVENDLREREARYKFISENSEDVIWILDVKSEKFLFQSDGVRTLRGYTPEEARDHVLAETITPESYEKAKTIMKNIVSQKQTGDLEPIKVASEFEVVHRSGAIIPEEVVATMTFDHRGNPDQIIGISRDITERKEAEKSLLQSEARLKEAQRIAHLGSWELDIQTGGLIWSDEVYNIFEADKKQFTPSYEAFLNAIHPEDRDFVNTYFTESVQKQKPYLIIHRLVMPDGRTKHVQEQGETRYDEEGRPVRSIGTVQDITDQITAETALLQSEVRYRSLFESARDAICLIKDKQYIDCNPSAINMFNCSRNEIIGQSMGRLSPDIQPDGSSSSAAAVEKYNAVMSGESQQFDWLYRRYDGTEFNAEVSLNKIILNREPCILAIVRDISERKESEEKIMASLREKETLLLELYHRTKNNMQVISAMINMSMERIKDSEALKIINDIDSQIHSMSLVHQKLYESRDLSHISLKEYLDELIQYLKQFYSSLANNLHFSIHGEDIFLLIDIAIPLGMVLNELLSNAIKHAFPENHTGSVTIELVKKDNNDITLTFSDNGIGLPDGFTVEEHASLGLFTSKAIIEEQLLGQMQYETGRGTTWTIQLNTGLYTQRV